MARLFATLIENKRKTINDVPANMRAEVIEILKERGLDENGDPLKA